MLPERPKPIARNRLHRAALRIFASLLLLLQVGTASAEWTGISLTFGRYDSDWAFSDETREAKISEIDFRIEERTASGLAVGALIGYMDLRVAAGRDSETQKFDGQYVGIYLRQDYQMGEVLSLHGRLDLSYHSGNESGSSEDKADIDWTEVALEIGIGIRAGNLRIMPFGRLADLDGDISNGGTHSFELDQADSVGVRFDIYTEQTAFIRIEVVSGADQGGYLTFVRRY
jgi:hypothetical protein